MQSRKHGGVKGYNIKDVAESVKFKTAEDGVVRIIVKEHERIGKDILPLLSCGWHSVVVKLWA